MNRAIKFIAQNHSLVWWISKWEFFSLYIYFGVFCEVPVILTKVTCRVKWKGPVSTWEEGGADS